MKKEQYEAPNIELININTVGKYSVTEVGVSAVFDEVSDVEKLVQAYGSPLFLLSENTLRENYRRFKEIFTEDGIETVIGYSYKTNYLPAVCSILTQEGAWAEVVADMEYKLARHLEVPGSKIIFNGPYKSDPELNKAISEGALINIDSFEELDRIDQIAGSLSKKARLGIRMNFRVGSISPWTKFGFNHETGDSKLILNKIVKKKNINFEAFHNHSGTFNVDPGMYARSTKIIIELAEYAKKIGLNPKIIDVGGGFPSSNKLRPYYDIPGGSKYDDTTLHKFANAIMLQLKKAKHLFNNGAPILMLEPGRAIVDDAMQLITKVVSKKSDLKGQESIIIDAGVNILPTAYWYEFEPQFAKASDIIDKKNMNGKLNGKNSTKAHKKTNGKKKSNGSIKVYGPLCMQIDCINENINLPSVEVGDTLVFSRVGAYNLTQSMQFIQTRPAVVLLGPNGAEVIRRKETWKDVFNLDNVPKRLNRLKESN